MHDNQPAPYDPATIDTLLGQNWRGYLRTFGAAPGTIFQDDATIFWYISTINENGIMWANLAAEDIAPMLAQLRSVFAAHGKPLQWLVGPDSRPANLAARLQALGLREVAHLTTMAADLDHLPVAPDIPAGVTMALVSDAATLEDWITAEAAGFETPPEATQWYATLRRNVGIGEDARVRRYLARQQGKPVATATLFLDGQSAGIFDVATAPNARRQGIAGALVAHALSDARAMGYHLAILDSSVLGHGVYQRVGFTNCTPYIVLAEPSVEGGVAH